MKSILLIGLGRFGKHIAMELHSLGHQVMAVDHNEVRVNEALPFLTSAQIGDSTSEDFLSSLGVRNFDVCIVAIGTDFQSSLETTSLLKELGARLVVSRAARDVHAKFLLRNGADEVVYPEKQREVVANLKKNIEVRSPITGVVTARNYESGDLFSAQPILHIMQIDPLKVIANISEQYFPNVKVGMPVELKVDIFPDQTFTGTVSLIYPALDPTTRTFKVEVKVPKSFLHSLGGLQVSVLP